MNPIDRRDFLKLAAGAATATGLALHGSTADAALSLADDAQLRASGAAQPNILYILTDQLTARALSCYSSTGINTPNIDRLAANGTLLTSAYTNSGVCTPSRAALTTGHYAFQTGASSNHRPMVSSPSGTIGDVCRDAGYRTSWLGKWHLSGGPKPGKAIDGFVKNSGFDDIEFLWNRGHWKTFKVNRRQGTYELSSKVNKRHYPTKTMTRLGIKRMTSGDRPWFCVLSYPDPHPPLRVFEPYKSMYTDDSLLPDGWNTPEGWDTPLAQLPMFVRRDNTGDNRAFRQRRIENYSRPYFGMVKLIDDQVGKIIAHLESTNQLDKTIVLFSTDHGELLGEYSRFSKGPALPGTFRLPMIWSGPGIAVQQRSELVSAIDLHATITELVGAPGRQTMGTSYAPMLGGGAYNGSGRVFFHGTSKKAAENMIGVISDDWFAGLTKDRGTAVKDRRSGGEMTFTATSPDNPAMPSELLADLRDHINEMKQTQSATWLGFGEWLL